ncbi:ParB-like nuclease domain containing protein [Methanonatronarchaeum thermophilum]|uniref:ParB-like nuclease domain containing protein n=1 Tax=Methanonatronarchaeum thermophilum TaxID=1927129 RepID=A0A1Y3G9L4_9EURY|nr:hypothetical protein [Methanonatronarchaeum thermophilum]OUJ18089.1 ParB-like nuclease domain containing protein [Methanonatronarchaeum thermophilum]
MKSPYFNAKIPFGTIQGGNWDKKDFQKYTLAHYEYKYYKLIHSNDIRNTVFFKSLKNHYIKNIPWEKTIFFKKIYKLIQNNVYFYKNIKNIKTLKKHFKYLDRLYQSIKTKGLKSQKQLKRAPQKEIKVDISRNGKYLIRGGRHRICISKILDIAKIPVVIVARHRKWIKKREYAYKNNLKYHPDFNEFSQ